MLTSFSRALLDSGKTLSDYFSASKYKRHKAIRCSDYIIIPVLPSFIPSSQKKEPHLDYDSNQMIEMAKNTINSLSNNKRKKVYPLPLALSFTNMLPTISDISDMIKAEKQYALTFNVASHGTPNWVGTFGENQNISPESLAKLFHQNFSNAHLLELKKREISFVFHTCNSAYSQVNDTLPLDLIKKKILNESFIGRFYRTMVDLGYQSVSVTGYRGYLAFVTSKNADGAIVQDSFIGNGFSMFAHKSRYTISHETCQLPTSDIRQLTFPVAEVDFVSPLQEEIGGGETPWQELESLQITCIDAEDLVSSPRYTPQKDMATLTKDIMELIVSSTNIKQLTCPVSKVDFVATLQKINGSETPSPKLENLNLACIKGL